MYPFAGGRTRFALAMGAPAKASGIVSRNTCGNGGYLCAHLMPNDSLAEPSQTRPVAYFDFDDTIVHADSMLHWQRWYARRRKLWWIAPWIWGIVALRGLGKPPVWMKRAFMATANRETPESRSTLVRQFSREFLSQCGLAEILDRSWLHHSLGHEIVVVTASPSFYLVQLSDMLPPHRLVATELEFHGRNLWNLPTIRGRNVKGAEKLAALREAGCELPREATFAYSDHSSDAPLLEAVEHAFAVRPDAPLETLARQRGWPVLRPVDPWGEDKTSLAKTLWLLFGPLGPRWPHLSIPLGKTRRRLWKAWRKELLDAWREASRENRQGFGNHCRALERISTRLKGAAPRLARSLVQKPLINLGHPSQPGMDRLWGTGQSVGLPPHGLDALQRMAFQAPGCENARLVPAPVWSDGLFQVYRVQCEGGIDRILKLLLPGVAEAVDSDLSVRDCECPAGAEPILRRSWEGLLGELRHGLKMELDIAREIDLSKRLRTVFPDRSEGVWIPISHAVAEDGMQGIVMDAADGFALAPYFSYLRETRRLRDPKADPTPDYRAFAALIATAGPLPQAKDLGARIWKLLSRTWNQEAVWLTLTGLEDIRVVPAADGPWILSMSDFAGSVCFPDWAAHALREWDVVCPEGSDDLFELCRAMGWQEHQLQVWKGRHRELVEVVWHPLLRGGDAQGFAFEDWRLDGRLSSLLGQGHQHESWPIPDPCRRVFRTLWWLRRSLAGLGASPDDPSPSGIRLREI